MPILEPRILVVDDEERMGKVLSMVLARCGYHVVAFQDGRKALEHLKTEPCDLVITDLSMPAMDGIAVLKAVKLKDSNLPVILITAHATVHSAITAMKEGAFDYIIKPFDNADLKNIVSNALAIRRLSIENAYLKNELKTRSLVDGMIGESKAMQRVFDMVRRVAASPTTVLIQGPSGTGKELVARALHYHSDRVGQPFVAVNCKALSESLLEAEIFGAERGAYTGADQLKKGRFELANGGTIFLDEIGEISPDFQGKLLRILQLGEFERVGGSKTLRVDVRVVAATNRNLTAEVAAGRFREDLFFRLNVIPLSIPPLQERIADIMPLAYHFLEMFRGQLEKPVVDFSDEVKELLVAHDWPGNVRELENAVERGVVLARGAYLQIDDLLMGGTVREDSVLTPAPPGEVAGQTLEVCLDDAARDHIQKTLAGCDGVRVHAAQTLGINRATLYRLMKKYGITEG